MAQIEKRVVITDSIERIFSYVAETIVTPEVWPGLIGVDEIQETAGGARSRQIYNVAGALANDRSEPARWAAGRDLLAHRPNSFEMVMEWVYQHEAGAPCVVLNADYTLWSLS